MARGWFRGSEARSPVRSRLDSSVMRGTMEFEILEVSTFPGS